MIIRAYLRASTREQNAERAKESLELFAEQHKQRITTFYTENVSGAKLERPELMRMIEEAHRGDILLIEAVDRLTRLSAGDWDTLRSDIKAKGLIVVALDLPTSHGLMKPAADGDEFQARMNEAINGMMLDMLAAMAAKDYTQRRARQRQGIDSLQADIKAGKSDKHFGIKAKGSKDKIIPLLKKDVSWTEIEVSTGCSRSTIARVARKLKAA